MINKKGNFNLTAGLIIRLIAVLIISLSIPFIAINPQNIIAIVLFVFGNFLLIIGGVIN